MARLELPQTSADLYHSFRPNIVDPESFEVVTGRGNPPLADAVGKLLDRNITQPCTDFADGETAVQVEPNLRGRELFVLQSMTPRPNDRIQEMVLIADAASRGDARQTSAIVPYFAYARQDRKTRSREPIGVAAVANQFYGAGYGRIFTVDIHSEQAEGAFPRAWDNVLADNVLIPALEAEGLEDPVVLAPDMGSTKRADKLRAKLGKDADLAIVHKRRDVDKHDHSNAVAMIGDVRNRDVVINDDMISTGGTIYDAAMLAKQNGARKVYASAAHGLFVPKNGITLPERVLTPDSPIDKLFVTDSIEQGELVTNNPERIQVVSIAPVIAVAILCYLTRDSIGKRLIEFNSSSSDQK